MQHKTSIQFEVLYGKDVEKLVYHPGFQQEMGYTLNLILNKINEKNIYRGVSRIKETKEER